jgi:MarR family transcriptional repressor of mepA
LKLSERTFFERCVIRIDWMGHQLSKYRNRLLLERCGITQGQSKILHMLIIEEGNVVTQRDIERRFFISASTVTSMLNTLQRDGYIRREADENDGRVRRIVLTSKGRSCESIIYDTAKETEERLMRVLTQEEQAMFQSLLKRLADNVRTMSREGETEGAVQRRTGAQE